ncbi:hypothetical protein L0Y46_01645, partial [bacterium]|nr:hypothetical protein [bacterium]
GTLCRERFYERTVKQFRPDIYEWIEEYIFGEDGVELLHDWMRGRKISADINHYITSHADIPFEALQWSLFDSARRMRIEPEMMKIAARFHGRGIKIGIITDNMDVFSDITIYAAGLRPIFHPIVNSADHGILKCDRNGELFDRAVLMLDEKDFSSTLLIDDSSEVCTLFTAKGGVAHHFKKVRAFNQYLEEMLK